MDGLMSWVTIDSIAGPKGPKGPPGTVASVSSETVPPGEPARATLIGTTDVHLHLAIPQGDPGKQGPPGVASSASARTVPFGSPANVVLSQHGDVTHVELEIPGGAPGTNGVPTAEAIGQNLAAPESPARPGLEVGMAQVASDPDSAFAKTQQVRLDEKANLVEGRVPDSEIGASTAATAGTIPRRAASGRLPGVGEPAETSDAATKGYVDASIKALPTFNVRDYGAVGDGVTDDTAAIQRAVTACRDAGGGTVLLPPGKYAVSGFVEIYSNITISGYGATMVKPAVRESVGIFAVRTGARQGYGAGGKNISIFGVTTLGRAFAGESATLLSAHHASQVVIRDCVGIMSVARGHWVDLNGCDGVLVENCTLFGAAIVTDTVPGEAIQPDVSLASSMSVPEDTNAGFDGLPSRNVTVRSSSFRRYVHEGTLYPAPVAYGTHTSPTGGRFYENLSFIDCVCEPTQDRTSGVRGAVHFISVNGALVRDSTFDGGTVLAELINIQEGYGDGATVESRNVKVESNAFIGGRAAQVSIAAGRGILVSGNTLDGFGGTPDTTHSHGIFIATVPKQFSIIGNTLQSGNNPHPSSRALYYNAGGSTNEGLASGNFMSGAAGNAGGTDNTNGRVVSSGNLPA